MLDAFGKAATQRFGFEAEGQIARAIQRLALIAAAGELAEKWGLTGWPPGAARDAALDVIGLWLEGRGGGGPAEAREAVDRVRAFIVAHGASRFEASGGKDAFGETARPVMNRAGWRGNGLYYFAPSAWAEIHKGTDPRRAARYLAAAGFLDAPDRDRLTKKAPRIVDGRPNCYAVKAEIIGGDDD